MGFMKIYANTSNSYPWSKFVGKDLWVSFDFAGERTYLKINRVYTDERGQCRVDFDSLSECWVEGIGVSSVEALMKRVRNHPNESIRFFNKYFVLSEPLDVYTAEDLQEFAIQNHERRYMPED